MDFRSTGSFDFTPVLRGATGPKPRGALAARLQGTLSTTVLAPSPSGSLVALEAFLRVRLARDGQEVAGQEAADLSRPMFLQVDPAGRVLWVRFDPATAPLSQSLARTLIAMQQVVLATPARQRWEAREEDPNGLGVAVYEISGPGVFRKRMVRFLRSGPGSEGAGALTILPGGSFLGRFDTVNGRLISMEGTETRAVFLMGRRVATAAASLRLQLQRRETLPPTQLAALRAAAMSREAEAQAVALSDGEPTEETRAALQRSELGSATVESLLTRLERLERGEPEQDSTGLYLDLKALTFLQPDSSSRLGSVLSEARADGPALRLLAMVLAGAGHQEAQAALIHALHIRRHDPEALAVLATSLGDLRDPSPAAEGILWDLALRNSDPEVAGMAQLTLGTMASHLSVKSPERAARIVAWAADRARSASVPQDRRRALLLLANAASARAKPVVIRALKDSAPDVRSAAAVALEALKEAEDRSIGPLPPDRDPHP